MNLQEHFAAIAAEKGVVQTTATSITLRDNLIVKDAVARYELVKKAQSMGLEITVDTPKKEITPHVDRRIRPIALVDISGSMITPENKAMTALVAQGMQDIEGDASETYILGVHTSTIDFGTNYDLFFDNKVTGGTILSSGFTHIMESSALDGLYSTGILYYLTDGDNWQGDNTAFYDKAAAMYEQGIINRMVIHIADSRPCQQGFKSVITELERKYEGIKAVYTDIRFENVKANSELVLAAFRG